MTIKYYDSWQEVPTDHIILKNVTERKQISNDINARITIKEIREFVQEMNMNDDVVLIVDYYDGGDYYGPHFEGLSIEYQRPETHSEFESRKISYQKEYMRNHKRRTPAQLKKLESERLKQEAKDKKEYKRLKELFGDK